MAFYVKLRALKLEAPPARPSLLGAEFHMLAATPSTREQPSSKSQASLGPGTQGAWEQLPKD